MRAPDPKHPDLVLLRRVTACIGWAVQPAMDLSLSFWMATAMEISWMFITRHEAQRTMPLRREGIPTIGPTSIADTTLLESMDDYYLGAGQACFTEMLLRFKIQMGKMKMSWNLRP